MHHMFGTKDPNQGQIFFSLHCEHTVSNNILKLTHTQKIM